MHESFSLPRLDTCLREWPLGSPLEPLALARLMEQLVGQGLDRLPLPGQGQTLLRWQALARVAACDLSLCKLFEGHTDALAIMQYWSAPLPCADSTWGMWAAESPRARVTLHATRHSRDVRLQGLKAWCSGASILSHGLLTAWDADGRQRLVAVALEQPGVHVTSDGWQAVGMAASQSVEVVLDGAHGQLVGPADGYLQRPGFWHGGAGIAACWHGAAQAIGQALRQHCNARPEPHALAHLGVVECALQASASLLRDTAQWIDQRPATAAELPARRLRAACEASATQVLEHVGRALGATPYCRDAHLARLFADLPVYLRQSHAERDLAVLGSLVATHPEGGWLP
ncbi:MULTISPECIES: acyl-CoA dehydrogenase [unclassified Pseudomonas]|uniref:acyl-CoA dehydrogenase n=1 Tax=unclassified Pseudomonas TaxID=196821 RepID=UPI0021ADC6B9|nr:acyl-CoA dehydrogenase [Pseudomonas sp. MSSRFD41]